MSYIGKTPTVGNFIKLDAITTSATNSYTLQHNSVNFSPESANHMLVSLNGVIQAPNTSFSVSGSTITFLPSSGTLSSSDSIDFIMVYGNVLDVGVATTVSDASITKAKMNLISDSSSAGLTIKGDGGSENGTLQLNCSQNSHGVKISSPAHSAGQSYELILPTGNVTADKVLKVASVSGSGATGIGQLSFGDAGGVNTPAFLAQKTGSNQTISNTTDTVVTFNTELFDTANNFASNVFTPTTAGKYYLYAQVIWGSWSDQSLGVIYIRNTNSNTLISEKIVRGSGSSSFNLNTEIIAVANGSSDAFRVEVYQDTGGDKDVNASSRSTYFMGYKLIE